MCDVIFPFIYSTWFCVLEVRTAAVESLCQLSMNDPQFANTSLDFLVDMFNDEIEDVRLKAIDSLRKISPHIVLREDQLETILGALEDYSFDVREGLHRMLAACRLSTTTCLQMCVEKLLDNLRKYPQDKRSTYKCLQKIGSLHPELTLPLVPQLLGVHPFFDTAEPDVDTPSCILQIISIIYILFIDKIVIIYFLMTIRCLHFNSCLKCSTTLSNNVTNVRTTYITTLQLPSGYVTQLSSTIKID